MTRGTARRCFLGLTLLLLSLPHGSGGFDLHGLEDNCILSFVVPRDKVKSSCDLDDRVTRRLNAMETKMSLSQQHVQRLEEQLARERQHHSEAVQDLTQRLARISASSDQHLAEGETSLVRRLATMEEEVRRLRAGHTASSSSLHPSVGSRGGLGGGGGGSGLGAAGAGGATAEDLRRRREEEEKAVANLVKTVVHAEVRKLFDNYTHYVGRYVRDQALAMNQILNMMPRPDPAPAATLPAHSPSRTWATTSSRLSASDSTLPKGSLSSSRGGVGEVEGSASRAPPPDREQAMLRELEDIRHRLNTTGRRVADRLHTVLQQVTTNVASSAGTTAAKPAPPSSSSSSSFSSSPSLSSAFSPSSSSSSASSSSLSLATKTEPKATSKATVSTPAPLSPEPPVTVEVEELPTATGKSEFNVMGSNVTDNDIDFNSTASFYTEAVSNLTGADNVTADDSVYVTAAAQGSELPPTIVFQNSKDSTGAVTGVALPPHQPSSSSSSASAVAAAAKSRMSHNTAEVQHKVVDKTVTVHPADDEEEAAEKRDKEGAAEGSESPVHNRSSWEENMVHDQSIPEPLQLLLKTEIQKALQQQADEVLSLVSKHSSVVDSKLQDNQRRFSQLEERLAADIKSMDQTIGGLRQELAAVSQGLQTLQSRPDKAQELEFTMDELRKNISLEFNPDFNPRLLATMLDEQGKKLRKMERLTDIYKQSLEHYRNETKLEYRDVKDRLAKETGLLRSLHDDLYANVTGQARQLNGQLEAAVGKKLEDFKQRLQVIEDGTVLSQIDLSSMEKHMRTKISKNEKDIVKLETELEQVNQRTKGMQKTLTTAVTSLDQVTATANATSSGVKMLQLDLKLTTTDEWVPYKFDYIKTRTDCFGDQYIRKSGFSSARLVGVVLCTFERYKIFLGQNQTDTFKNIGDDSGMGEDHCQFVGGRNNKVVKVSPMKLASEMEKGYVRGQWGQEPRLELISIIRPSPVWYECGVSIP